MKELKYININSTKLQSESLKIQGLILQQNLDLLGEPQLELVEMEDIYWDILSKRSSCFLFKIMQNLTPINIT